MKRFARIEHGKVVELLSAETLPEFHPCLHWQECSASAQIGWSFDGSGFSSPVVDLTANKSEKWEAIKAERDRRTEQGGYKVGINWFHSDPKSRAQQLNLVLLGTSIASCLQWKTMDGSFVTMTQDLAQQVIEASAASDQAVFATAEKHKAAMEASSDPASYDFSADWPPIFGE